MILIMSLRSEDFKSLKKYIHDLSIEKYPEWSGQIVRLESYSLSGLAMSRVALICNKMPKIKGIDFSTEATIPETRYCVACLVLGKFTILNNRNSSGYCLEHRELDPKRKQSRHQRYRQNRQRRSSTNAQN